MEEVRKAAGTPEPPSGRADSNLILGIDLGGTKCAACVADAAGVVHARFSAPTPTSGDAVVRTLIELAQTAARRAGRAAVGAGVSAGAPADGPAGIVFDAPNLPPWGTPGGIPLARILSEALGGLPVRLENDADATALAEHRFGAGRGTANLAFLTIGTGIGSGLIFEGRLHRGAWGAGGEIGHIAVDPGGRQCLCGLRGCLEAYASGPSIARVAAELGFASGGGAPAVIAAAREGSAPALAAVDLAGEMLGRALATLCMLVNPERIVLGTLAVHAGDLLLPRVEASLRRAAWPRLHECVTVVPAALGDRAQDLAGISAFLGPTPA